MISPGVCSRRLNATARRSALRQTVRHTWSSAHKRLPPGSTNDFKGARYSFAASISRSNRDTSASVTRGCCGPMSPGRVARSEPRLKSSFCTRNSRSTSVASAGT